MCKEVISGTIKDLGSQLGEIGPQLLGASVASRKLSKISNSGEKGTLPWTRQIKGHWEQFIESEKFENFILLWAPWELDFRAGSRDMICVFVPIVFCLVTDLWSN